MNTLIEFDKLSAQIKIFVEPTKDIAISDAGTNVMAQGVLRTIKDFEKQIEARRVALVKPLNDEVKRINEYARKILEPLEFAEKGIKEKTVEFALAEQKLRDAERQRIEQEERKAAEAARISQAAIEAEARAKAAAEEKARQIVIAAEEKRLAAEHKKKQAALKEFGMDDESLKAKADEERLQRKAIQDAENEKRLRLQEEQRLETQARFERETAEREAQASAARAKLEAERPKNTRKAYEWKIVDLAILPRKYFKVDEVAIGVDVRGGVNSIPGVEIKETLVAVAR